MLTEQLIDDLTEKMQSVTPAPAPIWLFLKWGVGTMAYIAVALGFMGVRPDIMEKLHSPLFAVEIAVLSGIIASSLFAAALLAFPDMYQRQKTIWLPALMFLLFAAVLLMEFYADNPPAPLPPHTAECLLCISLLSLVPGAFILYGIRKFASTHYYMAGKVTTLAAFSIGALALRLSEPTDSMRHLVEWHYLPMLGAAVAGLFLGKLCLKW